jgi:uncharacterized membrane protein YdfJ with MMPL/SSD domain
MACYSPRYILPVAGWVTRMPQTILFVLVVVIGLLLLAIGGCYLGQYRERRQLDDRTGPDLESKSDKR